MGDALGAPIEFEVRDSYPPITKYRAGGPFHLKEGQWTDDTSLALCIGMSLIEKKSFDAKDIITRFHKWFREGYMSCTGHCFDIGNTTKAALLRFEEKGDLFSGSTDDPATNGSIMRLAPIPLFYFYDLEKTLFYASESSRITHAPIECIDACRALALFIHRALHGSSKEDILKYKKGDLSLCSSIEEILLGSYKKKSREEIEAKGLATTCLEAALWSFYHSDNFNDGILLSVNLGEDSDTTGAVFGQLAGAFYGVNAIRSDLLNELWDKELIEKMASDLYKKINSYFYTGENPTVDLIVINPHNEVLLVRRSSKSEASPGMMAFPGGFIDSDALEGERWKSGVETPKEAALRELQEETNLKLDPFAHLIFIGEYSGNNRDPRDNDISWSKSHVFLYRIDEKTFLEQKDSIKGLDDADEAKWLPVEEVRGMKLAFDHNKILEDAL
ncbi:MAG: ADP-ribosylglycohydrolase family protein, partial [Bacteriovorax sp.]